MTDKLKQIVQRELVKLPKENQEAINAFDWGKISEEVGNKYRLNEGELNDFQVQTFLILIGLTDVKFYATSVENELGLSKAEAEKISEEVMQKIFIPISDAIVDKIKNSDKFRKPNAEQSLNFILSGGDYSSFMEKRDILTSSEQSQIPKKPTVPTNPGEMEDIKSKFTI